MTVMLWKNLSYRPPIRASVIQLLRRRGLPERSGPPVVLVGSPDAFRQLHSRRPSQQASCARRVERRVGGEEIHTAPVDRRIQMERLADVLDDRGRGEHRRERQAPAEALA